PGVDQSPAAMESLDVEPDYTCIPLKDAIYYIAAHPSEEEPAPRDGDRQAQIILPSSDPSPRPPPAQSRAGAVDPGSLHRLERLAEQILEELRRRHEHTTDFSVSKLMAGIAQILSLAILFVAYLNRATNEVMFPLIFTAIFCQLLTIALLIM